MSVTVKRNTNNFCRTVKWRLLFLACSDATEVEYSSYSYQIVHFDGSVALSLSHIKIQASSYWNEDADPQLHAHTPKKFGFSKKSWCWLVNQKKRLEVHQISKLLFDRKKIRTTWSMASKCTNLSKSFRDGLKNFLKCLRQKSQPRWYLHPVHNYALASDADIGVPTWFPAWRWCVVT